tara:strand:- start:314 stop:523 length:210 start_codon:yes stop_codon:yes gene_type:complete
MALSKQTLDYLLEAEGSIRSAVKCAATNESPLVVSSLSKLLYDLDHMKRFEELSDIMDQAIRDKKDERN